MYGVSTSASCRSLCELTRNMLCVLDGFVRFGVIAVAGRIVHPKHLECRLVYQDVASLGNHAGDSTDRIAHSGMLGHEELRAQAASHFGVKRTGRGANSNQRDRQTHLGLDEPGESTPGRDVVNQDTEGTPTPIH